VYEICSQLNKIAGRLPDPLEDMETQDWDIGEKE
jgi:hypothetical protein